MNGNDLHHLRQTYIHLFIVPLCRASEYVTGTMLARGRFATGAPPTLLNYRKRHYALRG
jgi:hypothetical protein